MCELELMVCSAMADQWHYRILGEDFGPVSQSTLRSLIDDGTIGPTDEVRPEHADSWQRADTLAAALTQEPPEDADLSMDLDALLAPSQPISQPTNKRAPANEWFYRHDGVQQGPLDFDRLFELVAEGRIARDDEILAPGGDDWVVAHSIVGLFPEEPPVDESPPVEEPPPVEESPPDEESLPIDEPPAVEEVAEAAPPEPVEMASLDVDDLDDEWDTDYLSDPIPQAASAAVAEQVEAEPEHLAPATDPPESAPSSTAAAYSALAQELANEASTAAPKAKRSGPSLSLPPNLGQVFANPLVVGGAVVVLVVVGLVLVPWGSLVGPAGGDLVLQLDEVWGEIKPLAEQDASQEQWDSLASKLDPRLQQIAQEAIDRGAGPEVPVLEIVRSVAQDQIPKVLESKQATSATRIALVDRLIGRAKELTE